MLKTEPAQFLVHTQRLRHVWLESISEKDTGIRVSVPSHHYIGYSDDISEQMKEWEDGDVVKVVLESEEEGSPKWRVSEIHDM